MSVFAAVVTDKGTGAISTVQVFGDRAGAVIKKIFKSTETKPAKFKTGKILLGTICDGTETIDQVIIGCEGPHSFAINCHGNPLIVEMIMQLLQRRGATLLTAEQLLYKILSAQKSVNTITLEAKLTQPAARTIEGTKIIANQIDAGLSKKIAEWLENINALSLKQITADAERILENSRTAKLIIQGCTAVIAGPPNTGKSTLLNYLAGRQKAIVTDIKGTTRDWVSARCQIGPLSIELIDTAGLDEKLAAAPNNTIRKKTQQKTAQILEEADLVLLVLDNSTSNSQLNDQVLEKITDKLVLTVLNKSDLPAGFDTSKLPKNLSNAIQISAKFGTGIENLTERIQQLCGITDFDLQTPVVFTSRQEKLLQQLKNAKSKRQAASIVTELLNGQLRV
ncbi:tRNA modification GTPase MnmE [subsurface metagenome]